MRKKRKDTVEIRKIRYYYEQAESDTIADFYARYLSDPDRKIEIDGTVFYRIITLDLFCRAEKREYLAVTERLDHLKVGDILTDENGNRFTVTSFPFICRVHGDDTWYWNTTHFMIRGEAEEIGEYLAVLPQDAPAEPTERRCADAL